MPSFNYPTQTQDSQQPVRQISITDKEYKHSIVETKMTPLTALLTHVSGATRTVDYYSQVLSRNEEPQKFSADLNAVSQQYKEIKDFELKQTDYSYDFDPANQEVTGTGTATIYPPLIPNYGDVFISDIGNGMVGLFTINAVRKKAIFKQACYEVDFVLESLIKDSAIPDQLIEKTVEHYYFVKDFVLYGQNPIIVDSMFNSLKDSERILAEAIDDYLTEFFSRELSCLTVPDYGSPTYDPFAVKAFIEVVETSTLRKAHRLNARNVDELKEYWDNSVWAALINPSQHQHRSFWSRIRAASIKTFNVHPRMNSIRFSGYSKCIYPVDKLENVDSYYHLNDTINIGYFAWYIGQTEPITAAGSYGEDSICWCKTQSYYSRLSNIDCVLNPDNLAPLIHNYQHVCTDDDCPCCCHHPHLQDDAAQTHSGEYYVFSENFYSDAVESTDAFEQLVKAHLRMETIDPATINTFLLQRRSWSRKDRYYKMLVLIIMLIGAIRSI